MSSTFNKEPDSHHAIERASRAESLTTHAMNASPSPLLTLYYDGGCPVCTREIGFYQRCRGAERIRWVDLASCEDSELGAGLNRDAACARLHARRQDGRLVSGAHAFAALWQVLPAFRLPGRIAALPGIVHLLEWGYRGFLKVRRLWRKDGAACPLPNRHAGQ
jgi:predicted DCC family thiol-disulfide oxidoreductase YuxK